MKKRTKVIFSVCLALFLIIGVGGYAYVSDYYRADEAALAAIAYQTDQVQIERDGDVIWFVPEEPTAGLILYPGGKVEHTAYAPLLRVCAKNGILCALVRMPGNLAVLDMNAADGLREKHPEVTAWYIAGHSLGGAMAANYAAAHSEDYSGLILLAAYSTQDLSQAPLRVLSVYGSEDGVLNWDAYKMNWANLPADTTEVVLDGGCHAQFGNYGPQDGDGIPTISGEEQIRQTVEAIAAFVVKCGGASMVFYFSGTGNSRYAAQRIADALSDGLLCMNDRIKAGDTLSVKADERLVIVTPTYAWRIPRLVETWLRRTEFLGARQAWFVMTCGGEIGNAAKYNHALCRKKQLAYMGTAQIIMPENYIAMFNAPQAEEARQIVARAEPDIDRAISAIATGQAFPVPRNNLYNRFMSGPVNPIFYSFFVKSKAFAASNACTGCGQCAKSCPTNNIVIQNGKPVWGGSCTHCMACICHCPTEAIEYGEKSLGKPRYHFEAL